MRNVIILLALLAGTATAQFKINIPGMASPQPGDIVVDTNKETRTLTCANNSVFLRGNSGDFRVEGKCNTVHVLGNSNVVYVDDAKRIVTEGNTNTVSYRNPNSGVSTTGNGNKISVARADK